MIGIFGGLILSLTALLIVYKLNDDYVIDFYKLGSFILGGTSVVNFILLLLIGPGYKIVFGCLSVYELIFGIILMCFTLDCTGDEWGLLQIVELVATLGLLIAGLLTTWTGIQWVVGLIGGLTLALTAAFTVYKLDSEYVFDFYISGTLVHGIVTVVNFLLLLALGDIYNVVFGCLSVYEIIFGVILTFFSFDEGEEIWGGVHIVETLSAVVLMLVGLIAL